MNSPQQNIAAFFDLDGTLLPPPSLEWRFIGYLLERDEISSLHVARWLAHFAKNILRDAHRAIAGNKFYLAGLNPSLVSDWEISLTTPSSAEDSLPLFGQGLERIAWHHARNHRIFLVTGTLAPLAEIIARRIAAQIPGPIEVQATELETTSGVPQGATQWTGRLTAEHMSNKAKARALKTLAATHHLDLAQSYAYGDSASDLPMLESVAHPFIVNPSGRLARIRPTTQLAHISLARPQSSSDTPARPAIRAKGLPMNRASQTFWSAAACRRLADRNFGAKYLRSAFHDPRHCLAQRKKDRHR
jgi:HAD superfamily hydrolase (TIGR01490 family)